MRKRNSIGIILLLLVFPLLSSAQIIISGIITDSVGIAVPGATITCSRLNSSSILSFSQSDGKGKFSFSVTPAVDTLMVTVKHVSYASISLKVSGSQINVHFKLAPSIVQLRTVVIKERPVYKQGDTLNYNTNAFTSQEDRVVGDVLKKLPGIEIRDQRIYYQGRPIQKYYINGLDLLEGKYGLANDNIPSDLVQKIQIIENDQPIRILDSLVFSNRASINIKLKKFTKTSTAKVGIGGSPLLWDVNLTPMIFDRTFQILSNFQANNIGDDAGKQLSVLAFDNAFGLNNIETPLITTNSFLDIRSIPIPFFSSKRWLDNRVNVASSNVLKKISDNTELKGSISFLNDRRQMTGSTTTTIFTPGGTINLRENIANSYNINDINSSITVLKNTKNIYLKNSFVLKRTWNDDLGGIKLNDSSILQNKSLRNFLASNTFTATFFIRKHLITLHSFINLNRTPQELQVTPGQFAKLTNAGNYYAHVRQLVTYSNLSTDNFISSYRKIHQVSVSSKIGAKLKVQDLESVISIADAGISVALNKQFRNDIRFQEGNIYFDLKSQYQKSKFRIEFNLPLSANGFSVNYSELRKRSELQTLNLDPSLYLNYQLSSYWTSTISSNYRNHYGNITSLYTGYLLTSYNRLNRFSSFIPRSSKWNSSLSFNYKDQLKSRFGNVTLDRLQEDREFLYSTDVDSLGLSSINIIGRQNRRNTNSLSADYSIYLATLKTILKLSGGVNLNKEEFIVNSDPAKLKSQNYRVALSFNSNFFKKATIAYNTSLSYTKSSFNAKSINNVLFNMHQLNINLFPLPNQIVTISPELFVNNVEAQRDQFFLDVLYKFPLVKKKIEFEITGINLLNNKQFVQFYNSQFSLIESGFQLRPMQVLAVFRFRL
ncbi:carboxypeptidase-like regulatory domain-containing protein [Paracnuella aquatica]|uniref:carboxypeptidase-like regulatory domain-containing protein n=1 Tax=Paracnuella aquatica TaxID=2268757 RepID=UPI000F4D67F6|nr:carboxypeptidase-like regulatory domain-containing protein [Paracnuella aquatica]RPD43429.1 hypothetical protein DRJ53_20190 [Paracnuella aquatica]